MQPQINQLQDNKSYLIRNHSGQVYKTIVTLTKNGYVFQSQLVTSSPNYIMDGKMLSVIPQHVMKEYFNLMRK